MLYLSFSYFPPLSTSSFISILLHYEHPPHLTSPFPSRGPDAASSSTSPRSPCPRPSLPHTQAMLPRTSSHMSRYGLEGNVPGLYTEEQKHRVEDVWILNSTKYSQMAFLKAACASVHTNSASLPLSSFLPPSPPASLIICLALGAFLSARPVSSELKQR